jgi:hypothetical protein
MEIIAKLVVDVRQLACQSLGRRGSFLDYQALLFLLCFKYMKLARIRAECRLLPYLSAGELLKGAFLEAKGKDRTTAV